MYAMTPRPGLTFAFRWRPDTPTDPLDDHNVLYEIDGDTLIVNTRRAIDPTLIAHERDWVIIRGREVTVMSSEAFYFAFTDPRPLLFTRKPDLDPDTLAGYIAQEVARAFGPDVIAKNVPQDPSRCDIQHTDGRRFTLSSSSAIHPVTRRLHVNLLCDEHSTPIYTVRDLDTVADIIFTWAFPDATNGALA